MRVLVVDDELPIRALTNEILAGAGYRVSTAASVDEAIALLDAAPFDALIVDLRLSGLDAADFEQRVSEHWPRLGGRLLWIADEPASDRPVADTDPARHLVKPFGTQDLLRALRALLAGRAE